MRTKTKAAIAIGALVLALAPAWASAGEILSWGPARSSNVIRHDGHWHVVRDRRDLRDAWRERQEALRERQRLAWYRSRGAYDRYDRYDRHDRYDHEHRHDSPRPYATKHYGH